MFFLMIYLLIFFPFFLTVSKVTSFSIMNVQWILVNCLGNHDTS